MSVQIEKKSVAGVSFTGTKSGKLDESAIPKDDFKPHYLFPGETKSESSYPVVDGDGYLRRGNVASAYSVGARGGVSEETLHSKLRKLNDEFDNPPIDFEEETESMTEAIEKHVPIAKADSDRQVAVGVAMVPNSVDLAGDFERPETIERLAEDYMERLTKGESRNGVMHSVFPDVDTISHVENRILQSQEEIGDSTYPAGTWQIGVKVHDDDLWDLITNDEGTLSGFSIGGYVTRERSYDGPPADVRESETVKDGRGDSSVTEIQDGVIEEISLVDMPAVPEAQVQVAKSDGIAKAAPELTDSVESASEYLITERGHDEAAAVELAEFLNRHKTAQADSSDSGSWMARAKAFFTGETQGKRTEKVGATLSSKNRDSMMQIHDASLDVLQDAGYASRRNTFTDDPRVDFELMDEQNSADPAESGRDSDNEDSMESELIERIESLEEKVDTSEEAEPESDAETDNAEAEKFAQTEEVEKLAGVTETLIEKVEELADNQEKMLNAQGVSKQSSDTATETETSKYAGSAFDHRGEA